MEAGADLTARRPEILAAFSLDAIATELLFVAGPALVSAATALGRTADALFAASGLVAVGSVLTAGNMTVLYPLMFTAGLACAPAATALAASFSTWQVPRFRPPPQPSSREPSHPKNLHRLLSLTELVLRTRLRVGSGHLN